MSAAAHRVSLERMYTDRATVTRHGKSLGTDGLTRPTPTVIADGVPCRWSSARGNDLKSREGYMDVEYTSKLFIAPECDIAPGDTILVLRFGSAKEYEAGEPAVYEAHQEVPLRRKEPT